MKSTLRLDPAPTAELAGGEEAAPPVRVLVCPETMLLANERCPAPLEMWLPPEAAPRKAYRAH